MIDALIEAIVFSVLTVLAACGIGWAIRMLGKRRGA